ncbi:hypothetical protein AAZX31_02G073200 [Glycine max]|uniref:Uncharacterized protein n=2 Tax=Glycine subgen. Soja TaxID=1462606 RepID=K7K704_SOYBN|nr:hypothetical protein JHK85_003638 [Glycine max]KHN00722.1 hypothetical protein glysoja_000390 [Glycine soja]KAG5079403.1 hypothetical protein JHK86_003468 [Glycine max]KAH1059239.1 hypothetical protein GYH30_003339 [Glycine max]KRH70240.1 hypothetical protein GLYMA_02G077800v4 [Glycine max]
MGILGAKTHFLCALIFFLMLLANDNCVCATRPNFQSMEQENNKKGASVMLMDSGKSSNFPLAKGIIPPSGPSHFHNLHYPGRPFNNKSH